MTFHETDIDLTSGTPSREQRGINSPGLFCSELQTSRPKVFFQGMARCEHLAKVTFPVNAGKDLQQRTRRSCISLFPCSALIVIFVVCSNKHRVKIEAAGGGRIGCSEMGVTTLEPLKDTSYLVLASARSRQADLVTGRWSLPCPSCDELWWLQDVGSTSSHKPL